MSRLMVLTGDLAEKGRILPLTKDIVIGRSTEGYTPELAFENAFISRRHAVITKRHDQFYIEDAGSRHGTSLNGLLLAPDEKQVLNDQDEISLSGGVVLLRFVTSGIEETLELKPVAEEQGIKGKLDRLHLVGQFR
ncbi:FHA domain-containing protein [Halobacillus litoralis]|uniref:FHA domain-containing protein n=1 Tax=Halobacillus litoralis TaxID=45668 RepID=UPI001CD4C57D|nr:FHA domain-containing protein [Halobacillus litoralis]MCA0970926.1 FHA domain-containing protein [Halobacillus litoralis]